MTGDVYRCVRSLRLWDEAHGYAESLGPFEKTMSDNKQSRRAKSADEGNGPQITCGTPGPGPVPRRL